MLVNDVSLRNLIPAELAKGFGFFQGKPSSAFSPVAVTPDELGGAWDGGKLTCRSPAPSTASRFGCPNAGDDMTFDFPALIAHAAKTRPLGAGTIIGSGTVSNKDRTAGRDARSPRAARGYACVAEMRTVETIRDGEPKTAFMHFGDTRPDRDEGRSRAARSSARSSSRWCAMSGDGAAMLRLDHVQIAIPAGSGGGVPRLLCRRARHDRAREASRRSRNAAASGSTAAPSRSISASRRSSGPARKAHPGIVVADLDALAARLQAAGHPPLWDDAIPGVRRFFTADPLGNRLEFMGATTTMAETAFASTGDLAEKTITFAEIGAGLYAYTAEGDPNSGIIVGDDGCMVVDAQATPAMAKDVIARVAEVTDKPIKYVVLSHYHAVRVLGASAYEAQGIVASDATYRAHRRARASRTGIRSIGRFPRLFRDAESIPGLTWPTLTFEAGCRSFSARREVKLLHLGARPHGGRHRRLGAGRRGDVLRRPRRVPLGLLLRRRASARMAR